MLFNSYDFIFLFLPIVLILFYLLVPKKFKLLFLLFSSYFFYGYWNYKFIPLLIFSTFLDFFIGNKLASEQSQKKRKILLYFSILSNLGLLAFFKYYNFSAESINFITNQLLGTALFRTYEIVLPVGISFYTFQSMSYTIDLYRKKSKAYNNFFAFAAYVSLFPQLIAGPIIRHSDLVTQLEESTRKKFSSSFFARGIYLFVLGLSKKVLIADRLSAGIDPVIAQISTATTLEAWACALGYTFQLYFDFSGYSDMAIGIGLMLGLKFPQNFNSPYKSYSITDFWRRWHITLSAWLRDYLYISLGGNQQGKSRTYINLMITMLLGGLWHGAAWTYVIWGGFHGALLSIERILGADQKPTSKISYLFRAIFTFLLVVIGWVIFRSENYDLASTWLNKMFSLNGGLKLSHFSASTRDRFAGALLISMIISWATENNTILLNSLTRPRTKAIYCATLLFFVVLYLGGHSPFLYFQF